MDEAAAFERSGALRALPYPVRFLGRRQRVEVDHRLPIGLAGRVARDAAAPPDSADVIRVLPEIIDLPADERSDRNPILGLRDVERLVVEALVARIGFERRRRAQIVLLYPGHRL